MKNHVKWYYLAIFCWIAGIGYFQSIDAQTEMVIPGGDWYDTDGKRISATEGGIIQVDDLYYLWGMDRTANNYAFVGINMYSSSDLKNWTFVNQILKKTSHPDLDNDAVIERAKLLHNKKTGQFIMWMHFEGHNAYKIAEVGLARCNTIGGNYTFQSHFRPMGIDSRDINVYQDDDGKAYLICTTEGNQSVSLFELDSTYTTIKEEIYRGSATNDMECEGHAIIKTGGYYFWLMSWCTGWDFNDNHYFYSKSLKGPWKSGGNVAVSNTHTYESQVGFAVPVKGSLGTTFLYMGDRWSVNTFGLSRIILLPIEVDDTKLSVRWNDQYDINTKTGEWSAGAKNFMDGIYTITAKHSGLVLGTNGSAVQQQQLTGKDNQLWRIQNIGASHFKISSIESGKVMDISGASREAGAKLLQYNWSDSYNQKWHIVDCGDGYHRFISVNTLGKTLEVESSSKTSGTNVVLGNFDYKDHQLFRIASANKNINSGKFYQIENRSSAKVLDVATSGQICQNSSEKKSTQVWSVEELYNGYYILSNLSGNIALDNRRAPSEAAMVFCDPVTKEYSQQWQIIGIENGYYKLVNRRNGKVLDNKDGSKEDGNPIIQYADDAASNYNQQWRFIEVDPATSAIDKRCDYHLLSRTRSSSNAVSIIYDLHGRRIGSYSNSLPHNLRNTTLSHGVFLIQIIDGHNRVLNKVIK